MKSFMFTFLIKICLNQDLNLLQETGKEEEKQVKVQEKMMECQVNRAIQFL